MLLVDCHVIIGELPHVFLLFPLPPGILHTLLCCSYARGSANRRLIPTLDQVLQRMEKAEGVVKKVKRRKKKSSNYAYVRKKKKKKKTGQAVEAQQSVVREETKNIQSVSEDVEELPTTSATGGDGSQLFAAVCEDSSSVSSEDLDALMK